MGDGINVFTSLLKLCRGTWNENRLYRNEDSGCEEDEGLLNDYHQSTKDARSGIVQSGSTVCNAGGIYAAGSRLISELARDSGSDARGSNSRLGGDIAKQASTEAVASHRCLFSRHEELTAHSYSGIIQGLHQE